MDYDTAPLYIYTTVSGQLPPRKIAPLPSRLGLGFGLRLVLELGSGGNCPRTLYNNYRKCIANPQRLIE